MRSRRAVNRGGSGIGTSQIANPTRALSHLMSEAIKYHRGGSTGRCWSLRSDLTPVHPPPPLSLSFTAVPSGAQYRHVESSVTPSWTPPGVFFPIMWILIIGPVRAYSSAVIFESTGTFCDVAHLSFILHLTVGDVWNTINNTECRYGASVVGVLGVVASVAFASYQYYMVDPTAGTLLGATSLWLCTAAALIVDTWRLNPRSNGERDPLYPVLGDTKTEFAWLSSSE